MGYSRWSVHRIHEVPIHTYKHTGTYSSQYYNGNYILFHKLYCFIIFKYCYFSRIK